MEMKIGFTGTQHGMTPRQLKELIRLLIKLKPAEFHHGDCIGADVEAAEIATSLHIVTVCHPPIKVIKRAFHVSTFILPPRAYLERNVDIVTATDLLIATPRTAKEQLRSGTWYTVRRARFHGKPVTILEP